jgi:hypothetical protein
MKEYDFEPVRGLPEPLPEGETMLWQGSPLWKNMAARVVHLRAVAIYFAVLLAWYAQTKLAAGEASEDVIPACLKLGAVALGALALMGLYARMSARTTVYTITSRRVVIRAGVALPMILNLPFAKIESADLRLRADGSGDISLTLAQGERVAYLMLWPHAQPWRLFRARPMLRGIPNAEAVAQTLGRAVSAVDSGATQIARQNERAPGAGAVERPHAAALA